MNTSMNLIGKTFGLLNVVDKGRSSDGFIIWKCVCKNDGNIVYIKTGNLMNGKTNSCGCLKNLDKKKQNVYDLSNDFGIGFMKNNVKFYFDLEDYEKIKNYWWFVSKGGVYTSKRVGEKKQFFIHMLILDFPDFIIDHKNRNFLDNRKENLRKATFSQNSMNKKIAINNTSGIIGVSFINRDGVWRAGININKKSVSLGNFLNFEDAVICRLKAEKEYYKEFAPQRHLFDKYGI